MYKKRHWRCSGCGRPQYMNDKCVGCGGTNFINSEDEERKQADLADMVMKYEVLKIADIIKYLSPEELNVLRTLMACLENRRKADGKNINKYLVINTDEDYAGEVIDIMKKHGHWGEDVNELRERAEVADQVGRILACGDLEDEAKLANINSLFYNE